ncbi:MAG: hypothetical protein CVV56_08110 [Tenericutes bacterium HGW-Tenericutes-1]|jgi:hypothetical protein|nr:MAG: hypothetical protein CVV56_08110 [Tenericutes bacterium HGW-Tenericutes-1]PKM95809.1 MAG: hypothetical protein CVU84_03140 [Firmicutes bacterium HGW-Firmicutes-1]
MAKKTTYETILAIGGKVQSSMGKAFSQAQKNISGLEKQTKAANATNKGFSVGLKTVIGGALAYKAFSSAKSYLNESVEAAKVQIEVETKLATVLKQRTNASESQIQSILSLSEAQEQLGIIEGDVQIAGAQQLSTFVNQTASVETLLPAMNNLLAQQKGLAATTGDAVNIGNLMGKVLNGQTGALTRVGISFSTAQEKVLKYGNEQEKAAMLAQVINENVGQMNKALAETDEGKIKQSTNMFGQMQEMIGKKILPIQAKFYGWFADKIPMIQGFVLGLIENISNGVTFVGNSLSKLKPYVTSAVAKFGLFKPTINNITQKISWLKGVAVDSFNKIKAVITENIPTLVSIKTRIIEVATNIQEKLNGAFETAKPVIQWMFTDALPQVVAILISVADKATLVYDFIANNWPLIEPIVYGIIGAFVAYKVINGIMTAYTIVTGIASAVTGAFGVAIAFVTSPIGLVVIAIGALIAIGVLLYKNWDKVKAFMIRIVTGIKDGIVNAFNNVVAFFKEWGPKVLIALTGPFGIAVSLIVQNWDTIKVFFSNVWIAIQEIFANVGTWFSEKFLAAVEGIKTVFSGIGEFFGGIFDNVVGTFKGNINMIIGLINFMIDKINGISIEVPDWVPEIGGKTIGLSIPNIPQLANGAYIKHTPGGVLANIGEGNHDEAVIPLGSRLDKIFGKLVGNKTSNENENMSFTYSPNIIIQGNADENVVRKALDDAQREFEKQMKTWLSNNKRLKFS